MWPTYAIMKDVIALEPCQLHFAKNIYMSGNGKNLIVNNKFQKSKYKFQKSKYPQEIALITTKS